MVLQWQPWQGWLYGLVEEAAGVQCSPKKSCLSLLPQQAFCELAQALHERLQLSMLAPADCLSSTCAVALGSDVLEAPSIAPGLCIPQGLAWQRPAHFLTESAQYQLLR